MARESELKHDTCAASRFLKLCFGFIVDVIVVETAAKEKRGMGDCAVLPRMRTGSKVGGSLHRGGSSHPTKGMGLVNVAEDIYGICAFACGLLCSVCLRGMNEW